MRLYAARGPLSAVAAGSAEEAARFFTELAALNRRTWESRNRSGSFPRPFAERFHRALIADCLPRGSADIIRVAAGPAVRPYVRPGIEVARPNLPERGLLGVAEPILIAGGRAVGYSIVVFIGIDVAKARNAVAIADGERGGEVRYLGEVDASEESMRRLIKRLAAKKSGCISAMRPARPAMATTASSPRSATPARSWHFRRSQGSLATG